MLAKQGEIPEYYAPPQGVWFPRKTQKNQRRTATEGPPRLPIGITGVAPLQDKATLLGWTREQCVNNHDPITGIPFAEAEAATLQELIRLHDRTCVTSGALSAKVAAEHKAGHVAMIPGKTTRLTIDDFKALRNSVRRRVPGYKIPTRKHKSYPPSWKLYISSDNLSGPDFASVLYVDASKAVSGTAGYEYPVDSVVQNLGFIPLTIEDGICKPQMVVDLIRRLDEESRLLTQTEDRWAPIAGFPYSKHYWQTAESRIRFNRLCQELVRALTTPL